MSEEYRFEDSKGSNNEFIEDLFVNILKDEFGDEIELNFDQKSIKNPYIIVDKREKRSGIPNKLIDLGAIVVERILDAGDYLVSNNVLIERKRGDDFYGSLFSGSNKTNLFDELIRIADSVENPILIMENIKKMFKPKIEESIIKSLYGAMGSIATSLKIPIIPTRNADDSALLIFRIASQQQSVARTQAIARRIPKRLSVKERQSYMLEGLYNVGTSKSKAILEEFGTPINFFTALINTRILYTKNKKPKGIEGDLTRLKGFGWKFVKDNQKLLFSRQKNEQNLPYERE